jgi:hypothetical protein
MVHVIVAVFAGFAAIWTLAIWLVGGFSTSLLGMTIRANDPFRPLALTVVAAAAYFAMRGPFNARRLIVPFAVLIAICPAVAGIARNSWTASGADQYAYVSQADLWLQGDLVVPVPLAATAPWPDAVWTFTPHGFRPAASGPAIVPVTAPGLSLAMAGAKAVAGHCAMFLVTPASGALLVWATFLVGRRISSDVLGLTAAWFIATSPVVLAMLVAPMSDVPAAALCALAIYFTLGRTRASAILGGLAASGAILVRSNLAPLAAVLVLWRWWSADRTRRTEHAVLMMLAMLPGCLFIAWVNTWLYGSPLASGYGSLSSLFSTDHLIANLARYPRWLVESQTPIAAIGALAVLIPTRLIWPAREQQRAALLLGATVVFVWTMYLLYLNYDAWWFLRFMLPSYPAICLGAAGVIVRPGSMRPVAFRVTAAAAAILIGAWSLRYAATHGAFPSGEGDHRYATIAKMVEQATDPSAVIITGQHSGPIRYYAGRTIVRFDLIDPAWLDRVVQWLTARGRPPHFLLEEYEVLEFEKRFSASNAHGKLTIAPIMEYRAPGVAGAIYLFDPARPDGGALMTSPPPDARDTCVLPSPLLHLR